LGHKEGFKVDMTFDL